MNIIVIILLISTALIVSYYTICYSPIFPLSQKQKEEIRNNGLLHFTDFSNYDSIVKNGLIGSKFHMGFPQTLLGEMIWMYSSSCNIEEKHNILCSTARGKQNNARYGICIHITQIPKENINHMYTRKSDNAIVYRGKQLTGCIELIKKW